MILDTERYKAKLLEAKELLSTELRTLGIHNPGNPSDWIATPEKGQPETDPIEVADRTEEWNMRASTLAALETRYNNIRRALEKIETGTYGHCEVSGEEIEAERLDAEPTARTCALHREEEALLPQ